MKFVIAVLCLAGFVAANDDGQWRGEGLAESQDWGQYNGYGSHGAWNNGAAGWNNGAAAWNNNGAWAHGAAPLGHDGRVVDTPEVAAAKAAHLAALNGAGAHGAGVYAGAAAPASYGAGAWNNNGAWAHGAAPLGHDGRVVDTPEVAAAKAAHLAAASGAGAHGAWNNGAAGAWNNGAAGAWNNGAAAAWNNNGAWAHGAAPLGHDGRVVDTPEVAAAKAAHLAAASGAGAHGAHGAHW